MNVTVIGLGYIGLPTAALIASKGIKVVGVDVSQHVVSTINKGKIHIIEPDLDILVQSSVQSGNLRATTEPEKADIFIIAVPTPFKGNHEPDLSYIKSAAKSIAMVLEKGNLVILESTSPVGTTEKLTKWISEERSDLSFPEYSINNEVDVAVSLFFQTEDQSGSSFQCIGGTRNIIQPQQVTKPLTCPSPMIYSIKDYWSYCLLEDLTFPSDLSKVQEYCDYVDQGYEGFTFSKSDFPNYKCPSSLRQGDNSDGTVFCTYDLPSTTTSNLPNDTQPFCTLQAFQAGELGFKFNNNGSTPTPTSHTSGTVYCSRAWDGSQEGTGGDCYFILPAKESFSCSGSGINMSTISPFFYLQ